MSNRAKPLSDEELMNLLYRAGFRGDRLVTAFAVAKAESNGRPKAYNPPSNNTGDDSYGIFQINMIGDLGPDRRKRYELERNEDLFDAERNARVAFEMSNKGKDWGAWTTYTGDKYKQFLGTAKKVFEQQKRTGFSGAVKAKTNPKQEDLAAGQYTAPGGAPSLAELMQFFYKPYESMTGTVEDVFSRFFLPGEK